jgi:hypothetical protein
MELILVEFEAILIAFISTSDSIFVSVLSITVSASNDNIASELQANETKNIK